MMINQNENVNSGDVRQLCSRKLFELLRDQQVKDNEARLAITKELQQRRDYLRELAALDINTENRPH